MGEITVSAQDIDRLLHDPASPCGAPYQRVYARLAGSHRGRPSNEIVPLLRTAADGESHRDRDVHRPVGVDPVQYGADPST
ncbi:hypothetical protein [Streptomyces zaomyceticus]|uniref:hypothetical protein n=1 Tax=Streptomyces zaomyceticus TaxID=68286 RepID=UPI00343A3393